MRRFRDRKAAGHYDKSRALVPQLTMHGLIEQRLFRCEGLIHKARHGTLVGWPPSRFGRIGSATRTC